MLQRLGVSASRTLFVGDSYENDVVGSKRCGMHSVFLVRPEDAATRVPTTASVSTATADSKDKDNAQVMDLAAPPISAFAYRPERKETADRTLADVTVSSLEPDHFADKLKEYFTGK